MLVSLAILGFAATMLAGGVDLAGRFAARTARAADTLDATVAAQGLLRERLAHMLPIKRLDSSDPIVDAEGNADSFVFWSLPPQADAPDAPRRYRILVSATGDLMLLSAGGLDDRLDPATRNTAGWATTRLLEGVAHLTIGYFGPDRIGIGRRWQAQWNGQPALPELIRLRIAFADGRHSPDLIVRPHATLSGACAVDPLTGRCGTGT